MHCGEKVTILKYNEVKTQKRRDINFEKYNIVLVTYSTLAAEFKSY